MDVTRRIGVIEDPRFQDHIEPTHHPEAAARLVAVGKALEAWRQGRPGSLTSLTPSEASDDDILLIHTEDHLRTVKAAAARGHGHLDADTFISPASYDVARLAAGSCVDLAMRIASGELDTGFAALRPPGHHAESRAAMGFCLFNSVAVTARALQQHAGIEKVLIFDWDVHHGNGSQHSFESDPSILYMSTHQFPFYPGTGAAGESGLGMGLGATFNVPMPQGCGDFEYLGVMQHLIAPVALEFDPDFILVSCGFDAHEADPLGSMNLTANGFHAMTQIMQEVAESACGGRIAYVLEGGYSAQGLIEGTTSVLAALSEPQPESRLGSPLAIDAGSNLAAVVDAVRAVHSQNYTCIKSR